MTIGKPIKNKTLSKTAYDVMSQNEKFLFENFRDVLDEIVELVNDVIDCTTLFAKQDQTGRFRTEKALHFYAYHVLMPSSNAITINLLTGNLPACFRELRFLVEMLAKCYLADVNHSEFSFFERRLHVLHYPNDNKKRPPEIEFINDFAEKVGLGEGVIKLWRELSEETHARKYAERVVDNVINRDNVPPYALIIPMVYRDGDKNDLN